MMPTLRARGRVLTWLAPVLVIGYAVLSIVERRNLHADGSWALIQSLMHGGYWVGDPYRLVADMIAETPFSLLALIGVTDRSALTVAHGVGYILVPSLAWAAAMWISRSTVVFEFLIIGYSATALTSGFLAIGEYNYLFAFAALCFAATMRFWTRQTRTMGWLVAASALVVMSSHGLALLLAPLLLVALVLPMRRLGVPRIGVVPTILGSAFLLVAIAMGALAVVFPYTTGNVRRASDLGSPLLDNHQLQILIAALVLLTLAALARPRWLRRASLVLLVIVIVTLLLVPALWASPWLQHASRTWSALLLFLILAECLVVSWPSLTSRQGPMVVEESGNSSRLILPAFALFAAFLIPAVIQTLQFGSYARTFEVYVNLRTGIVSNAAFARDVPETERYGWPATYPSLSVALATSPDRAIVANPEETIWDPPFDEHHPPQLPAQYWPQSGGAP
jgi:hypothetical protein